MIKAIISLVTGDITWESNARALKLRDLRLFSRRILQPVLLAFGDVITDIAVPTFTVYTTGNRNPGTMGLVPAIVKFFIPSCFGKTSLFGGINREKIGT